MNTKQKFFRIILVVMILSGVGYLSFMNRESLSFLWASKADPAKTNLKQVTPSNLVGVAGLEKEMGAYDESYILNYGLNGGKQSTVTLRVSGGVEDRYKFYEALLKKEGWLIKRSHIGSKVSFLYGVQGDREINITITTNQEDTSLSKVSISMYRK